MESYITKFEHAGLMQLQTVGYKCAFLGELHPYDHINILLPEGFVINTSAYRDFVSYNDLENRLNITLQPIFGEKPDYDMISAEAQRLIMNAKIPSDMGMAIIDAYDYMNDMQESAVSVSCSFMFEMPFKKENGNPETGLNVEGHCALLYAVKKSFAGLFCISSLKRIRELDIQVNELSVAVCVQLMVRADKGCSGLVRSADPEFLNEEVMHITGRWGLAGGSFSVNDEFDDYWLFKPSIFQPAPLVELKLGEKKKILTAAPDDDYTWQTVASDTPEELQHVFLLNYHEIIHLGKCALLMEKHFRSPVQFTWAKDGIDHQIYILSIKQCPQKEQRISAGRRALIKRTYALFSEKRKADRGNTDMAHSH